jgi:colicin import membrane protein
MMLESLSYRNSFFAAVTLHVLIAIALLIEATNTRPVLVASKQPQASQSQPLALEQKETIKAVSVNSEEVMKTVTRLKEERLQQKQAEENRQKMLTQQADAARKQRVEEQQRLEKLKNEAAKLAIAREKQLAEEQRRLKQMAIEKAAQEKSLAEIKNQQIQLQKKQQQEAAKLAELQKKKAVELANAEHAKVAKEAMEAKARAKSELEKQQQAAAQQAAMDANKNAQMAGEVDKYKALIIDAISRRWILPENASNNLSSQFRIRLAPNGVVLEVSLTRSSGDPILDRSAQSAIYKASPLPVPSDPGTFNLFRDISLTVRPENARG